MKIINIFLFLCLLALGTSSSSTNKIQINVGCFGGRKIRQYEPALITLYSYKDRSTNQDMLFFYDFGDGTTTVSSDLVVRHIYRSSGRFNIRAVETDSNTNISFNGYIGNYAQTTIYVFPNQNPFKFRFESSYLGQDTYDTPMIEIPFGKSTWNLTIVDYTRAYINDTLVSILGLVDYIPLITTSDEDLSFHIEYNRSSHQYQVDFDYIGTKMNSFSIQVAINISIGPLLPAHTEFIVSTPIFKFGDVDNIHISEKGSFSTKNNIDNNNNKINSNNNENAVNDADMSNIREVHPIPYFGTGAAAMTDKNTLVITNDNFFKWSEMPEKIEKICVSSSRVFYLNESIVYSCEFSSNGSIFQPLLDKNGEKLLFINASLFDSPMSGFRKSENIDAPDQILIFANETLFRVDIDLNIDATPIEPYKEVLFASAFLDKFVTIFIYEDLSGNFYRCKVDNITNKATKNQIAVNSPVLIFQHDFTKKLVIIDEKFIYVSSDFGISAQIAFTLFSDETIICHASAFDHDEVVLFTSKGRIVLISPELTIGTVLFELVGHADIVLVFDFKDDLLMHINGENSFTLRIPIESIVKVLSFTLPGEKTKLVLKQDYGNTLTFAVWDENGDEIADNQYELSHLSLYGTSEECRFITGTKNCEILAFDSIIQQILISGEADWDVEQNEGSVTLDFDYFSNESLGFTISIPSIDLIFVIKGSSKPREAYGELISFRKDAEHGRFDFLRLIDLTPKIKRDFEGELIVSKPEFNNQNITINNIKSRNSFTFDSSMIGMSLFIKDEPYPIVRVTDSNIAYIVHRKGQQALTDGVYDKWTISWDDSTSAHDILLKSWTLRFSNCESIEDPAYYPVIPIRSHSQFKFNINITESSTINSRVVSNEQISLITYADPFNLSFSFKTPSHLYSLTTFVISLRDSSPQCKHTYTLGISARCSADHRFLAMFNHLHNVNIPKYNYRPPSFYGMKIGTTSNIYNVNPEINKNEYKNKLKMSKGNFEWKQCKGAKKLSDCKCQGKMTNEMEIEASDCIRTAYRVEHGKRILIDFFYQTYERTQWKTTDSDLEISIREINGRRDLCIGEKCEINERVMKKEDAFFVTGLELYHFEFTLNMSGCLYRKYAVFWCDGDLLSKAGVFLTMSSVLLLCVLAIEFVYFQMIMKDRVNKKIE